MPTIFIETAGKIIGPMHNTTFNCPFCGVVSDASESDVAEHVVSFWGDEDHEYSCSTCGKDFVVRETVMRSFETGDTSAEIDKY